MIDITSMQITSNGVTITSASGGTRSLTKTQIKNLITSLGSRAAAIDYVKDQIVDLFGGRIRKSGITFDCDVNGVPNGLTISLESDQ